MEEEKIDKFTWLKDINVNGNFTKVARTRALKALEYAGKLERVCDLLEAWNWEMNHTGIKHPTDEDLACGLVYGYPRGWGNPYSGDKTFAYVTALFRTIKEANPEMVENYLEKEKPNRQMKIYIVSYCVGTEVNVNNFTTEVYVGFDSVWDIMRKLFEKYGTYPLIQNIYTELLPSNISETLHFLYGNGYKNYTTKEWFENYDMAVKYLKSAKEKPKDGSEK